MSNELSTSDGARRPTLGALGPWMPSLIFAVLTASYLYSGFWRRAAMVAVVTAAITVVAVLAQRRGRALHSVHVGVWLPIALPAVLSRYTELSDPFWPTVPLLAAAVAVAFAVAWGLDLRPATARVGHAVGAAVRAVAGVVIGLVILMPLGIARLWRRADPLGTGGGRRADSSWHDIAGLPATPRRTFRVERSTRTSTGRALVGAVPRAVGVVVILLAVDFGLGWVAFGSEAGSQATPSVVYDQVGAGTSTRDPMAVRHRNPEDHPRDPRVDLPALADYPWANDWFQEWNSSGQFYWPYLIWRNQPFEGEYLNLSGWERRTYRAPGVDPKTALQVGFFGGSTTFGVAQRDQYTIASDVARLAEQAGIPIVVHNYGVSGYTNWQEMLLFEQLAAAGDAPDVAVFYDGANEISGQRGMFSGVPSHPAVQDVQRALSGPNLDGPAPQQAAAPAETSPGWGDLWTSYRDHSFLGHVARGVRNFFEQAAGAAPAQGVPSTGAAIPDPTAADAQHSIDVYKRGRELIRHLASRYDVQPVFFWQPRAMYDVEKQVLDQIDAPTIDISDSLDPLDESVFIDGNHTNEKGAMIVAQAIWKHLEPVLRERAASN